MATISTQPALIIPKREAKVIFTPQIGNWLRVFVTNAPLGSEYRNNLDDDADGKIEVDTLKQIGDGFEWTWTPDKGGKYSLAIQEYYRAGTFGNIQTTTLAGDFDEDQVVTVAQRLTQRMGTGGDAATLVVYVSSTYIRRTSKQQHGEASPVIIEPSGPLVATAIQSTAVRSALAALAGTIATTSLGTMATVFDDIMDNFVAHLSQGSVHANNDTDNAVQDAFGSPDSPTGLEKSTAELIRMMRRHFENNTGNADGAIVGPGSGNYHEPSGTNRADWANRVLVEPTRDTAGQLIALADMHRAYSAHRTSSVHDSSDATNTLNALPALLALHSAFIAELQKTSPTTPTAANEAATTLIHAAGFEEKDPT